MGAAHLFPRDWLGDGNAVLAADIGGTNMRAGLVALGDKPDLSDACRGRARAVAPRGGEADARGRR